MLPRPLITSFLIIGAFLLSYSMDLLINKHQLPTWVSFASLLSIGLIIYSIFTKLIIDHMKKNRPDFDFDTSADIKWLKNIPPGIVPIWFTYMSLLAYSILIASIFSGFKYFFDSN